MPNPMSVRHYFVDEAGDPTLFNRKGKVLIGQPGCSRFFILGLLDVPDPTALHNALEKLRNELLTDPYFSEIPSMQPERKKTATAFHAKDDLPEVRWEVMKLLRDWEGLRFFAVVADKLETLNYVRSRNRRDRTYRYHPTELYDYLVRRLFRDRLHKASSYHLYFARRGRSDRTAALKQALEQAQRRFAERWDKELKRPHIDIYPAYPKEHGGLQAVDYFLWALQRLYERGEDRFVTSLWPAFRLVIDMDDKRHHDYGTYY